MLSEDCLIELVTEVIVEFGTLWSVTGDRPPAAVELVPSDLLVTVVVFCVVFVAPWAVAFAVGVFSVAREEGVEDAAVALSLVFPSSSLVEPFPPPELALFGGVTEDEFALLLLRFCAAGVEIVAGADFGVVADVLVVGFMVEFNPGSNRSGIKKQHYNRFVAAGYQH